MKILIADDDKIFRMLVSEILTNAGYEVAAEENGALAWEKLQADGADMAVLDVNMPEMDGFQLLRNIRTSEKYRDLPVLMLTVRVFAEDQIQGYETGADDYLAKPFDNAVLLARIKVLERRILKRSGGGD